MNNYTIYCTEEQTRKALGLGAPIERVIFTTNDAYKYTLVNKGIFITPTAEQMQGWLEEQGIREVSLHHLKDVWHICIYLDNGDIIPTEFFYASRKEATLEAIDAALEYLNNNKNHD